MPQLQLAGVIRESIVDGPGIRFVVFAQGCPHHCPGCQNPATHDPQGGYTGDTDTLLREFRKNPLLAGITLSGGDPFLQPEPLAELAREVRAMEKTSSPTPAIPLNTCWITWKSIPAGKNCSDRRISLSTAPLSKRKSP